MSRNHSRNRTIRVLPIMLPAACLFASLILCMLAPKDLNKAYLWASLGLFWGLNLFVLFGKRMQRDRNWLTPEIVFMLPYWLYQLAYVQFWLMRIPPFTDPGRIFYYQDAICFSSMMAVAGWAAFVLGYNLFAHRALPAASERNGQVNYKVLRAWSRAGEILLYLAVVSLVLIVALAPGRLSVRYGERDYEIAAGLTQYTILLLTKFQNTAMLVGSSLVILGRLGYSRTFWPGWKVVAILGFHGAIWSLLGNRSAVVYPVSVILVGLSEMAKPIRFAHLVAVVFLALVFLDFVGLGRSSQERRFAAMVEQYQNIVTQEGRTPIVTTLESQAASAQTLYAARAVVPEIFPYGFGRHKISEVLAIVPFGNYVAQRFGFDPMSVTYMNSAYFLTYIIFNGNFWSGAGSTICADLYLDFGLTGVVCGLFLLGFVVQRLRQLSRLSGDVRYSSAYFAAVAILLQMPRRGIVDMFNIMIWVLAVMWMFNIVRKVKIPYIYRASERLNMQEIPLKLSVHYLCTFTADK